MNNLIECLTPRNLSEVEIEKIRKRIPVMREKLSGIEIERIWRGFSETRCASWLLTDKSILDDFAVWIRE